MKLSLADAAFALDPDAVGPWSLRASLAVGLNPALPAPASLRGLLERFSQAGADLRDLASSGDNLWQHVSIGTVVTETSARLRDPFVMQQAATGFCGPISIIAALARREPARYVRSIAELLSTGKLTCPTGRTIEAEAELRAEPLITKIAQADWVLAAALRDDENIWEDVDDDANGLESMTFWGEQRDWVTDVLALAGGSETCFVSGEVGCMRKAQNAAGAGGVAYFLIDRFLLKDGGSDHEEESWWARARHDPRTAVHPFGATTHSKDDDFPPDHWVEYLDGLDLGSDPGDDDPIAVRLWSWGSEYVVTGTVGSFSEYLYAVCYGT